MTDIIDIQIALQDTVATLAQLEAKAVTDGDDPAFIFNYNAVEKRRLRLEQDLREAAAQVGREVCRYRLESSNDKRISAAGIAGALGDFQLLLGLVYDALQSGARDKTAVSDEAARRTELDFAYAMAGSAVFVFTVPGDTDLNGDSLLNRTVEAAFGALTAKSAEEMRDFRRRVGSAPVKVVARWARDHARHDLIAEVSWSGGAEPRSIAVSPPDLARLSAVLNEVSEDEVEEHTYHGTLVGASVANDTFHFLTDGDENIRGRAAGLISTGQTVELPRRYTIRVRRTTRIVYATEQQRASYVLLELTPLAGTVPQPPLLPPGVSSGGSSLFDS